MEDKDKLITGLLCHIGKTMRGNHGCKKCPYREEGTGNCHGKLAFDALSYIFASEHGKHLLDGMANISEATIEGRPPDHVLEDIRNGKGGGTHQKATAVKVKEVHEKCPQKMT